MKLRNALMVSILVSTLATPVLVSSQSSASVALPLQTAQFTIDALESGAVDVAESEVGTTPLPNGRRSFSRPVANSPYGTGSENPNQTDLTTHVLVEKESTGQQATMDVSLAELGVASAVGTNFADVSWVAIPDAIGYRVARDGVVLTETTGTSFRDPNVIAGGIYSYTIAIKYMDLANDEETATPPPPPGSLNQVDPRPQAFGIDAEVPPANLSASAATVMLRQASFQRIITGDVALLTQAYIPNQYISVPIASPCTHTGPAIRYSGDNRGWSNGSATVSSRVEVVGRVTFRGDGYGRYQTSTTEIGTTKLYYKQVNGNWKLHSTKTASRSGSGMLRDYIYPQRGYVDTQVIISAGMPYCKFATIAGSYNIRMASTGAWYIKSGDHRLMPRWEIYMSGGGRTRMVYSKELKSPYCLADIPLYCARGQMSGLFGSIML